MEKYEDLIKKGKGKGLYKKFIIKTQTYKYIHIHI